MISRRFTLPELSLFAATRAACGAGIGLLLADRLISRQRRDVGWALVGVGVVTTLTSLLAQTAVGRGRSAGKDSGSVQYEEEFSTT